MVLSIKRKWLTEGYVKAGFCPAAKCYKQKNFSQASQRKSFTRIA